MEEHIVKITRVEQITHDVRRFTVEKPAGYSFIPGQATEISISTPELKEKKNPFTFTCLNEQRFLEFTIKIYREHHGITDELGKLAPGAELIIRDVWGAINYAGQGIFIAGGAGVTPFIAIFRYLNKTGQIGSNKLFFSNKTSKDIILKEEFSGMLGENFVNILTRENNPDYYYGHIDEEFISSNIKDFKQHFYVCGPKLFVKSIQEILIRSGAAPDTLIIEK